MVKKKTSKPTKSPAGVPTERELIKAHWGWSKGSFKSEVIDPDSASEYGWLRVGNQKFLVTKRVGEAFMRDIQQINMSAKMGDISREALARKKKDVNLELIRDVGRTSVLFENISKASGIDALFSKDVNLNAEQKKVLKSFSKNIEKLSSNKELATDFYKAFKSQFKNVADVYKKYKEQGSVLTQEDVDELMASVNMINQMAEKWIKTK